MTAVPGVNGRQTGGPAGVGWPPPGPAGEELLIRSALRTEERSFSLPTDVDPRAFFGGQDANLKALTAHTGARLVARGSLVKVQGSSSEVERVMAILGKMVDLARSGTEPTPAEVHALWEQAGTGPSAGRGSEDAGVAEAVAMTARGRPIRPRTAGQRHYVESMQTHDLTFAIGPAGTGKTYLAVAMAVAAWKQHQVARIILTRPAVEAGERLGFLPGDLQEKVNPYLRPLYDALFDLFGQETFQRYMEKGIIEVAPLAYMRGRTLDDSFIILDEAQNTTPEQMKMFLTRLGFGSRAVVTGDVTQVDLPEGKTSGLRQVQDVLRGVPGIAFCFLTEHDVVRHPLVQRIVRAYEEFESRGTVNQPGAASPERDGSFREGEEVLASPAGPRPWAGNGS